MNIDIENRKQGYLKSKWQTPERGVPRKYYKLTKDGVQALNWAREQWELMVDRANMVLDGGS